MTPGTLAILFLAAAIGGGINSVAGGGSFVSFPALIFAGVNPVPANATNTIALWPGAVASAFAYRRELSESRRELVPLGIAGLVGGAAGSVLLLKTSDHTFVLLIPWLLLFATVLFTFGGGVTRRLAKRAHASRNVAVAAQLLISLYGGYFGGGMAIMVLAVLSVLGMTDIHRMNSIKVMLAALVNGVAAVAFVVAGAVAWVPGSVMIAGGILGGYAGAAIARRVEPQVVRRVVLVVAWAMTGYFFLRTYA